MIYPVNQPMFYLVEFLATLGEDYLRRFLNLVMTLNLFTARESRESRAKVI